MKTLLLASILILPFAAHAQELRCEEPELECATSLAETEILWPQEWRDGAPPVQRVSRKPENLCVVLCSVTGPRIKESCQIDPTGDDISIPDQLCVMKVKNEASACMSECSERSGPVRR